GDHRKNNDAGRHIGQIALNLLPEQAGVEIGKTTDHDPHARCQPERPYDRATVALPNVMPTERAPQFPELEALDHVGDRIERARAARDGAGRSEPGSAHRCLASGMRPSQIAILTRCFNTRSRAPAAFAALSL